MEIKIENNIVGLYFLKNSLPISMSSLYAHKYFDKISKNAVTKIFEYIRDAFSQTLDESQWLDDETREKTKRKLHSVESLFGFPDEIFDSNNMENFYRGLDIDPNKYLQSYLNIRAFTLDQSFRELRLSTQQTEWTRNANAMLSSNGSLCILDLNTIHISAHSLQEQLFNIQRPNYMNFGTIGSIIGHEIIHGFCGDGCSYNASGQEQDWWQPVSAQTFSEKAKCLIEQYSNYTARPSNLKINGLRTLEENICDNGGVKHSYLAYKLWIARNGEEPRLPRLNYTPQQMFWISYAQMFCGKFTEEGVNDIIANDTHSPHELRVNGVLRNMEDFSRDFNCPANSPMNPVQKCEIW